MSTFDVRIEEGGRLGVKLTPEPLCSKVWCLRVAGVNDATLADRSMLQVGDLLLAINGATFSDPKEFLQWVRMPPYLLTVLRKEDDSVTMEQIQGAIAASTAAGSFSGSSASSSSGALAHPNVEGLVGLAIQKKLPEGWKLGQATGVHNNCMLDSLLQLLQPDLDAAAREEQATTCRALLVEEDLCTEQQFLTTSILPQALALLGVSPEQTTVCILGFAEMEQEIAPERVGSGVGQLLLLANVNRHSHFVPVFTAADKRIQEGLQVVGAIEEPLEREAALDGMVVELLEYTGRRVKRCTGYG